MPKVARVGTESVEVDHDLLADDLGLVAARRSFPEEASSRVEVEAPQVVDAPERSACDLSFDEWVPLVGTGVFERMDLFVDAKERNVPSFELDQRAAVSLEGGKGNRVAPRHAA